MILLFCDALRFTQLQGYNVTRCGYTRSIHLLEYGGMFSCVLESFKASEDDIVVG